MSERMVFIMKTMKYSKPNINLKGKKGKKIFQMIQNTPKSSHEQLKKDADECMKRLLARKTNV